MSSREERRETFDEVADLYDRFRPGYPEPLVDDVVWLSGVPRHGKILENCQQADGSVVVPEPLRPYAGGLERIA